MWNNDIKYKKRLILRCIHHFKTDLINNMDHMRISGIEPSSVILSQTKLFQKLKWLPESANQAKSWSQKGCCNKPTKLKFLSILILKILMLSNATNRPKSTVDIMVLFKLKSKAMAKMERQTYWLP